MQSTLREIQSFIFSLNFLICWVAASVACVLIQPFGSGDALSLLALVCYWFINNALTMVLGSAFMVTSLTLITKELNLVFRLIIGATLAGFAISIVVWLLNMVFYPAQPSASNFISLFPITFTIGVIIAGTIGLLTHRQHQKLEALKAATDAPDIPFFKRLPVHLGKQLLYLSTQDHYVEAVTTKGSHMILMRFSDALDELKNAQGVQIHRSHWVAKDAIIGSQRKDGRLFLQLSDGKELPVSRSFVANTKDYFRLA